ncbi:MAG: hypothetical protein Q4F84_04750 [Fibrobacter sp.]|nr:hypothetical protein [Fibrobacter sp.]
MKFRFGSFCSVLTTAISVTVTSVLAQDGAQRMIAFGTTLSPDEVVSNAKRIALSIVDPQSSQWQAKGDLHRSYYFDEANEQERYRVCVPQNWDGKSKLPLVMFLHGAGNDESSYLDHDNKLMVRLADEHGFILVSPIGANGAYGNFLRLSAPFGNENGAAELMAQVTPESERTNQLSEKDVINVLELVLHEYPIDTLSMFLTGHSMGSGGTWYIGGKYSHYWNAVAPMSGPFVQKNGYPWDSLHAMHFFVTEGVQTPSLNASRAVRDWMIEQGFDLQYKEVDADHGGMVPLVLPDVFKFFEQCRISTQIDKRYQKKSGLNQNNVLLIQSEKNGLLKITTANNSSKTTVRIFDLSGKMQHFTVINTVDTKTFVNCSSLPSGKFFALAKSGSQSTCFPFVITK